MSGKLALQIFVRTFAQIALPVLLAAGAYTWATSDDVKANAVVVGLGLLTAFVGAVVAVLQAYAATPAATALGKAARSAVQAIVGVLATLVFNSVSDITDAGVILAGGVATVVLAFVVTYLQYLASADAPVVVEPTE